MIPKVKTFLFENEAATTVEYAVMLMLIAGLCTVALQTLGTSMSDLWNSNNGQFQNALGDLDK